MATVAEIVGWLRLKGGSEFSRNLKNKAQEVKKEFATVKTAIAGAGVFLFLRNVNEAANQATAAFAGLQSVASFKRIQGADQAVKDLEAVRAGLMSDFDAAAALKNLLSRGYNLEQAVQTLNRLGEAAAFGKVSHLSLGEAVKTATEGLKNENSILVDNAGVTKNVSILWKEYAESIGKGVMSLTTQEKIQAEVNGIMRETEAQVGDLAKLSNSAAGEQARMAAATTRASASLGVMVQQISAPFVKLLTDMVDAFNRAPAALQNLAVAMGVATAALYVFSGVITKLLPMIGLGTGPVGWVILGLTAVVGLFAALQSRTEDAAKATERYRKELAGLTIEEAQRKLAELEERFKNLKVEMRTTNTQMGGTSVPTNLAASQRLKQEIGALKTVIAEKKKLEIEAAMPAADVAALNQKQQDELKDRLDNQREFEFEHQKISRQQYLVYLRTRQKDFEEWTGDWTKLQEEILEQEGVINAQREAIAHGTVENEFKIRRAGVDRRLELVTEIAARETEAQQNLNVMLQAQIDEWNQKAAEVHMFFASAISNITQSIAEAAMTGQNAFKAFFKSLLIAALDAIEKYFIVAKIKAILDTVINPFQALKNIVPLAIATGLIAAAKSQIAALAEGSLIT